MKRIFLKRGFTLIEVLVVVTLIGILSTIIYANFGDARQDARNKALRSEIKGVQLALELYKSQNGRYPLALAFGGDCSATEDGVTTANTIGCGSGNSIIDGLVPEFITSLPSHTLSANPDCNIKYSAPVVNTDWYKLVAENCFAGAANATEGIQPEDTMARCPSSCSLIGCGPGPGPYVPTDTNFYRSFAVYSAGGQCE